MSIRIDLHHNGAEIDRILKNIPDWVQDRVLPKALNRMGDAALKRIIRKISAATGIPQKVLKGNDLEDKGKGGHIYAKRAKRRYQFYRIIGLTQGVRAIRLSGKAGAAQTRVGARAGRRSFRGHFLATMPSGHMGIFHRVIPSTKVSATASPNTKRKNLKIKETVLELEPHASRIARAVGRAAMQVVLPRLVQQGLDELQHKLKTRS